MKQQRKRKAQHFPDPADRYLGKMALLSFCLMLTVALLSPVKFVRYHATPKPVVLWKAAPKTVDLAALTPGCDVHDWACVLGRKP